MCIRLLLGRSLLGIVLAGTFSPAVQAQIDQCAIALTETGRNDLQKVSRAEQEAYFYRRVCESTQTGTSLDTEGEYFKVAKGMLGFAYQNSREYCSAEGAKQRQSQFDFVRTSTVVETALKSWVECLRITRQGIAVRPQIFKERAVIGFERTGANVGIIRGVDATAGTTCIAQLKRGWLRGSETVTLQKTTEYRLPDDEQWTVTCDRKAISSSIPQGQLRYPRTIITVGTSAGPFSLQLDDEPLGTEKWANDIAGRFAGLEKTLADHKASVSALNSQLVSELAKLPRGVAFSDCVRVSGGGSWPGANKDIPMACPDHKVVRKIYLSGSVGQVWTFDLDCCSVTMK